MKGFCACETSEKPASTRLQGNKRQRVQQAGALQGRKLKGPAGGRSTADADPAAPRGHQQHDNSGRAHPLDDPARTKALKDSLLASKCWMTPEGGLEALPADVDVEADGIAPAQVGLHPRPRDVIHTCGICGSNANSPPAHGCVRCPPAALRGRLARPHLHQRVNLCRMDSILKRPPVKRRQPCLKAWRTSKSWSPG